MEINTEVFLAQVKGLLGKRVSVSGARPLKRFLQKNVETLSARLILSDEVSGGDTILIDEAGQGLYARVV